MNLAEEMRPKTLEETIGNETIRAALERQFSEGKLSQSYLFSGKYGSGKTTYAKIIAARLDAEITEIDCGSEGSIDKIREIIESSNSSSLFSDNKVFILDEAHRLGQPAQSALLKTLEEPKNNVHFILITTEPNKLLKTVRSRCVEFETRPAGTDELAEAIRRVRTRYNVVAEDRRDFYRVVEAADGSLRQAYAIMERLISAAELVGESLIDPTDREQLHELLVPERFRSSDTIYRYLPKQLFLVVLGDDGKDVPEHLPKAFLNKDGDAAMRAIKELSKSLMPLPTALGIYNYIKKVYLGGTRKEHVPMLMAGLSKMLSDKEVTWMHLESLVWEHLYV